MTTSAQLPAFGQAQLHIAFDGFAVLGGDQRAHLGALIGRVTHTQLSGLGREALHEVAIELACHEQARASDA